MNDYDKDQKSSNSRVAFKLVRLDACIMPKTTAASELCCDVCRCSASIWAWGTPAGIWLGTIIWLGETPLPSTQYVVIMPLPLTVISPRFCKFEQNENYCKCCAVNGSAYEKKSSPCKCILCSSATVLCSRAPESSNSLRSNPCERSRSPYCPRCRRLVCVHQSHRSPMVRYCRI